MSTTIEYNNRKYTLPSDCSLSVGNSCDTRTGRMYDGSKTSYGITTYRKAQVNTYSLNFNLSLAEYSDILKEVYKWEGLVGKTVKFSYCDIPFGSLIIVSISVSFGLDGTHGITSAAISFSLKDNMVVTQKTGRIATRLV